MESRSIGTRVPDLIQMKAIPKGLRNKGLRGTSYPGLKDVRGRTLKGFCNGR